jgi:uncharacterized protein
MKTLKPLEPQERIEILDVLRGFALLGIILNNMLYFSGYSFMPFDDLKQITNFQLDESIFSVLDFIIRAKFYTLFSILFAVGFYLQFNKYREYQTDFIKVYRRRIFILLIIGLIHSLIWFGDILFTYSIMVFILILFRNVKAKNILRWSLFFMLLPILVDFALLPFVQTINGIGPENIAVVAHVNYPDMAPKIVIDTFQNGTVIELFILNIHNFVWKYLGYIPSGRLFVLFGIFLFGYNLASIGFFSNKNKSYSLLISSLIIGLIATISSKILGGSVYQFPPTLSNTIYKLLLTAGQISMCIFYITSIFKIAQTSIGKMVFKYLIPVGRMALTNYLSQTIIMIIIFYNFGFNLIGRLGLIPIIGIVFSILVAQIIFSNIWLRYFRFGPFEWIWRSLTYKKRIRNRLEIM